MNNKIIYREAVVAGIKPIDLDKRSFKEVPIEECHRGFLDVTRETEERSAVRLYGAFLPLAILDQHRGRTAVESLQHVMKRKDIPGYYKCGDILGWGIMEIDHEKKIIKAWENGDYGYLPDALLKGALSTLSIPGYEIEVVQPFRRAARAYISATKWFLEHGLIGEGEFER